MENVNSICVEVNLYSVTQALDFLKKHGVNISDTWLRKRMISEDLSIYRVGKTNFVMETDLYRLYMLVKSKPGLKMRKQKEK